MNELAPAHVMSAGTLRLLAILSLLLPPLIFYVGWSYIEYEEKHIFSDFVLTRSSLYLTDVEAMRAVADAAYDYSKDDYPLQLGQVEKTTSEFANFKTEVSERFSEQIGAFSALPIHNVCLVNRNKVYLDEKLGENLSPEIAALAIRQSNGYFFYARRGFSDCKAVSIRKFRESPSSIDTGYVVDIKINPEQDIRRLKGEAFSADLATTSILTSDSAIVISLGWWVFIPFYFFSLFAWSFIFFQYKKILNFLRPENFGRRVYGRLTFMSPYKQIGIDVAWGFGLWAFGYVLGMMLFTVVPVAYIGLVITPFGLAAAIWVCMRQFRGKGDGTLYLLAIGAAWLLIAYVFDYIFLVRAFNVQNYYDYDVLFYYLSTLLLPLIVGRWRA